MPAILASRPSARRLILAAAWLALAPMVAFVAARLIGLTDRTPLLFALETLTPWLLLPAHVLVLLAGLLKARALLGTAVAVAVLHLVWVAPVLRWWPSSQPEAAGDAFVVASANVAATNTRVDDVAAMLRRVDADVLVIVELTPELRDALSAAGMRDRYPHSFEDPRTGFFGSAIYSRFPLSHGHVFEVDGFPMTRAVVDLPGATTDVIAVHTLQPLADLGVMRHQLEVLDRLAHAAGGPVILAGDFNATAQHAPFRALLDDGIRDAHASTGRAWARTWPAGSRLPPFALLDHVLVSASFAVLHTGEVAIPGSDHRAVKATLASARADE